MTDEDDDDVDGPMEALVALVAVVTLPAGILAAVYLSEGAAGIVFVVGWLFLVPVLAILAEYVDPTFGSDDGDETTETAAEDDALDRLRERYAAGEIDEAEFEGRLERLIETEDVEVAGGGANRADGVRIDRNGSGDGTAVEEPE